MDAAPLTAPRLSPPVARALDRSPHWWRAAWGIGGVFLLLVNAIVRLLPIAREALHGEMTAARWAFLAACVGGLGYAEGYRAFQRGFVPRVVRRAVALAHDAPSAASVLLAPMHCMSLFADAPSRVARSWAVTLGVVAMIVGVRALPQPWRGLLDAGVVVALAWGAAALASQFLRAWRDGRAAG